MSRNCLLFLSYKLLQKAKTMCYQPESSIEINNVRAKIIARSFGSHYSKNSENQWRFKISSTHLMLYLNGVLMDQVVKACTHKQVLPEGSEFISDANIFISSIVFLKPVDININEIMLENPASLSIRFCRLILIEFSKETPEETAIAVDEIKAQITTLVPTLSINTVKVLKSSIHYF